MSMELQPNHSVGHSGDNATADAEQEVVTDENSAAEAIAVAAAATATDTPSWEEEGLRAMADLAAGPFGRRSPRALLATLLHLILAVLCVACAWKTWERDETMRRHKQLSLNAAYTTLFILAGIGLPCKVWSVVRCEETLTMLRMGCRARSNQLRSFRAAEQSHLIPQSHGLLLQRRLSRAERLRLAQETGLMHPRELWWLKVASSRYAWLLNEALAVAVPVLQWLHAVTYEPNADGKYDDTWYSSGAFFCFMLWFLCFVYSSAGLIEHVLLAAGLRCIDSMIEEINDTSAAPVNWRDFTERYRELQRAIERIWSTRLAGGLAAYRVACLVITNIGLLLIGLIDIELYVDVKWGIPVAALACGAIVWILVWRMAKVTSQSDDRHASRGSLTSTILDHAYNERSASNANYQSLLVCLQLSPIQISILGHRIDRGFAFGLAMQLLVTSPVVFKVLARMIGRNV